MILPSASLKIYYKLSLAALLFCVIPQAHAGASNKNGNPYGNGSFFSDSGTFSAVVRSSNAFLGVMQLITSSTNSGTNALTNVGIATIYASGQQYVGQGFATIDPYANTLAATYFGNSAGQIVSLPVVTYNSEVFVSPSNTTMTVITPVYGLTNFNVSNNISGQFQATLKNAYPNQVFSGAYGSGQANATVQTVSYTTSTFSNASGGINTNYRYNVTNVQTLFQTAVTGCRLQ